MGFDLASITAAGVGATLSGIGGLATSIREAIVGKEIDPAVTAQIELRLAELEQQLLISQMQINLEEAKSESLFVSGWRPAVGWVCCISLAYNYVFMPLIVWVTLNFYPAAPAMPTLETSELSTLLLGMLGLGAMRSFDKKQAPAPVGKE